MGFEEKDTHISYSAQFLGNIPYSCPASICVMDHGLE